MSPHSASSLVSPLLSGLFVSHRNISPVPGGGAASPPSVQQGWRENTTHPARGVPKDLCPRPAEGRFLRQETPRVCPERGEKVLPPSGGVLGIRGVRPAETSCTKCQGRCVTRPVRCSVNVFPRSLSRAQGALCTVSIFLTNKAGVAKKNIRSMLIYSSKCSSVIRE